MSTIKVDTIKNRSSAINLPNNFKIGGSNIVQGYTSSGSEPGSPSTGDFWWDSTNSKLYRYIDGGFKEIGLATASASATGWFNRITYSGITSATGSSMYPLPNSITSDSSGNIYVVGTDEGRNVGIFTKLNTDGAHQWTKAFGTNSYYARINTGLVSPDDTKLFLCGHDYGWGDNFGSGAPQVGMITKVSTSNGALDNVKFLRWNTISSGSYATDFVDSAMDSSGNIWSCGALSSATASSQDIFVSKTNSSLVLQGVWRITDSQNYSQTAYGINIDSSDNVYISGLGYGASSGSNYHALALKFNSSMALQWRSLCGARAASSTGQDVFYSTPVFDSTGEPYFGGYSKVGSGANQASLIKLNKTNGNITWAKQFNGTANALYVYGMAVDSNDTIYCHAESGTSADRNVLAQFDTSGNITDAHTIMTNNSTTNDLGLPDAMNTDSNGNVIITYGNYAGTAYKFAPVKLPATVAAGTYTNLVITDKTHTAATLTQNLYTHTSFSVSNVTSSFSLVDHVSGSRGPPQSFQTPTVNEDVDVIS